MSPGPYAKEAVGSTGAFETKIEVGLSKELKFPSQVIIDQLNEYIQLVVVKGLHNDLKGFYQMII